MIELRNVSFAYNGKDIFHDLNLHIAKGEFAVLLGGTGSGKTTLLQLLIGELLPQHGEIVVGDFRVHELSKGQLAHYRRSVGFVFEEMTLLEERDVAVNVGLPLEIEGGHKRDALHAKIAEQLAQVHLSEKAKFLPRQLSLGEGQRAAIARALIKEPLLLIADSLTAQLDEESSREIIAILDEQNIRGMTVVLAMPELSYRDSLPRNTVFYRFSKGQVQRFLPETPE